MKHIFSKTGEYLLGLKKHDDNCLTQPTQFAQYTVLLITNGEGVYHADFGTFPFSGPVLLFSTPLQTIYMEQQKPLECTMLQFHSDFYCIEYHRAEVSCNGLLFNNIYLQPSINLTPADLNNYQQLINQLDEELSQDDPSEIVLRAYLQLFLAKSSSIKIKAISETHEQVEVDEQMEQFKELLNKHYLT
jgi:hypothetical protein